MCKKKYGIEKHSVRYYPSHPPESHLDSVEWFDSEDERDEELHRLQECCTGYSEYEDEVEYNKEYYRYIPVETDE